MSEARWQGHQFTRCWHKPNGGIGECPYAANVNACHAWHCGLAPEEHLPRPSEPEPTIAGMPLIGLDMDWDEPAEPTREKEPDADELKNIGALLMAKQIRSAIESGGRFSDESANWILDQLASRDAEIERLREALGIAQDAMSLDCVVGAVYGMEHDPSEAAAFQLAERVVRAALAKPEPAEDVVL